MRGQLVPEEGKCLNDSLPGQGITYEPAFLANADGGQAKPGGNDAGTETRVIGPDIAPVLNQAGLRVTLFPEEKEVSLLKLVQKLIVGGGDLARRGWRCRLR